MRPRGLRVLAVTVAAPFAGRAALEAARRLEESRGQNALARGLRHGGTLVAEAVSYAWLSLHLRLLAGSAPNARRAAPLRLALVVFGLGNVMPAAPAEGLVMATNALKRRRVDPRRIGVLFGFLRWFNTRALLAVASVDALVAVAIGDVPHPYSGGLLGGAAITLAVLGLTAWLSMRRRVAETTAGRRFGTCQVVGSFVPAHAPNSLFCARTVGASG